MQFVRLYVKDSRFGRFHACTKVFDGSVLATWGFVLFIVLHVYMAFWYDAVLKEGTISSMVSGYMFEKGDH